MILSLLSNAEGFREDQLCKVKRISDGKTNEELNRSFFHLKNLGGLATISEYPATSATYHRITTVPILQCASERLGILKLLDQLLSFGNELTAVSFEKNV